MILIGFASFCEQCSSSIGCQPFRRRGSTFNNLKWIQLIEPCRVKLAEGALKGMPKFLLGGIAKPLDLHIVFTYVVTLLLPCLDSVG